MLIVTPWEYQSVQDNVKNIIDKGIEQVPYDWYAQQRRSASARKVADAYNRYDKADKLQSIDEFSARKNYEYDLYDLDKYLEYAKDDFIKNLSKTDENLAYALQQATESYSAGNLFGSGIANQRTRRITWQWDKEGMTDKMDDIETDYLTKRDRAVTQYRDITKPKQDIQRQDLDERFKKAKQPLSIETREQFVWNRLDGF